MINILIQARFGSKRFFGKALKKIHGHEILYIIYKRLKKIKNIDIHILTSYKKIDSKIYLFCKKKGIKCFRGSHNNVLKRYVQFIKVRNIKKPIIRISGDSPFIDPSIVKTMICLSKNTKFDLISNKFPRSFPKGQTVEIIHPKSLINLLKLKLTKSDKEHVTSYFYKNSKKFNLINLKNKYDQSKIDLTVDNVENFLRLKSIVKNNKEIFSVKSSSLVKRYLKK